MLKRIAFIILGFRIGIAFDMLPHVVEVVAKTNVCHILSACHGSIDLLAP